MPIGSEISLPLLGVFSAVIGETLENRVKFLATGEKSGAEVHIAGDSGKFNTFI